MKCSIFLNLTRSRFLVLWRNYISRHDLHIYVLDTFNLYLHWRCCTDVLSQKDRWLTFAFWRGGVMTHKFISLVKIIFEVHKVKGNNHPCFSQFSLRKYEACRSTIHVLSKFCDELNLWSWTPSFPLHLPCDKWFLSLLSLRFNFFYWSLIRGLSISNFS